MSREEFRRQYNFSLGQTQPGVSTGTPAAAPVAAATTPAAPAAPVAAAPVAPSAPAPAPAAKVAPVKPQAQAQPGTGGGTVSIGAAPQRKDYPSQTAFNIAKERYDAQLKLNNEITAARVKSGINITEERIKAEQKPGAEAKGKIEAKDINNQNYADTTYGLIRPISDAINQSTGSGIGSGVDKLAGVIGVGTKGAENIARLETLGYQLLSNVPRFEGPQSDIDVQLYKQAAGDLSNSSKPINVRLAALDSIVMMLKKYDKAGKNDWSFGSGGGGIKILKREKVQ
jgi:hypothetical protein